jgi:hypothetical protein
MFFLGPLIFFNQNGPYSITSRVTNNVVVVRFSTFLSSPRRLSSGNHPETHRKSLYPSSPEHVTRQQQQQKQF